MKYSLNIEEQFTEMDFYKRIGAAKKAGFHYIEFWGWQEKDIQRIQEECEKYQVKISGFKGDLDWSLVDNKAQEEFISWIRKSVETAKYFRCDSVIIHSNSLGAEGASDFRKVYSPARQIANMASTLIRTAPILEESGITMYVEPLNNLGENAGLFLTDARMAADIIRAVDSPNIKMLCDLFHMQIMHGDLERCMIENLDIMDYIHIGDAPGRHEPGTGEINYEFLLDSLKKHGFDGIVCFEFEPESDTDAALVKINDLKNKIGWE